MCLIGTLAVAGCTLGGQSMGISIWEENNECGFRISNMEQQQALKPASGCIRWLGDKCTLHYGDECRNLKE